MQLWKRGLESFKFLFKNPLIFLVYLPITLLGLISVYVNFDSVMNSILGIVYILMMLILTSFVFTYLILKAAYYENGKKITFKQNFQVSVGKFFPLVYSEFILIVGMIIISTLINFLVILWTSNFGIAVSIVLAVCAIALMIKVILFAPSCVLKGGIGFDESWKIVRWKEFLELALLVIIYALISFGLSYIPYAGYLIDSLVFGPFLMVIITFLYLDYLKK